MPPKFAQNRPDRDRDRRNDGQIQPSVLAAAELHYRVSSHPIPPRPAFPHYPQYQSFPKASSSTIAPSASASTYSRTPYHQRLVAAALATPALAGAGAAAQAQQDDQQSSNDSSSAPSSNVVSSGVLSAGTGSTAATSASSSSVSPSKGKEKITSTSLAAATAVHAPVPSVARPAPTPVPVPAQIAEPPLLDPDSSYFERLMVDNAHTLPEPGPYYFEHQRMLWKTAPPNPPRPSSPGHSRIKLESLLSQPGAVESEEVWRAGLKNVWKGLVGGNQLKKRLPLHIVLKILQAGWLRDGTWPEGMTAPPWEPGQQLQSQMSAQQQQQYQKPSRGDSSSQMVIDNPHYQQGGSSGSMAATQYQRRAHEQEAYAAALHARASEEQASGTAQMMHMQAYAMMGLAGGIPPGYSPSSGENPEDGGEGGDGGGGMGAGGGGYYVMPYPYPYSETTPPSGDLEPVERRRSQGQEYFGRDGGGGGQGQGHGQRRSLTTADTPDPPPSPGLHPEQDVMDSEMDTEDEEEAAAYAEEAWRDVAGRRMEGVVQTGDGRHEGG